MGSPDVHDRNAREEEQPADRADPQGQRLGDAQRRIAALTRRTPDDVRAPDTPASESVADELSALAAELTSAHEHLRVQTKHLEHARQLLESERARFRELFEVALEGHVITDVNGTIEEANRSAGALFNMPVDRAVGKPLVVFIDPEDRRPFRLRVFRARNNHAEEGWTTTLLPRESEPMRVFLAVSPVLDSNGSVIGLRWLIRDVSSRRASAVWDRTPAAVLRSAIDALSSHIAVVEADGTIVTANSAWRDALRPGGLFDPSGAGSNYLALCDGIIRSGHAAGEIARAAVLRVLDGRETYAEAVYSADGQPRDHLNAEPDQAWFALRVTRCEGPEPALVVVTHEDITPQRRALARETALIAERSARAAAESANRAKSEFLTTLSHELRTPLNAIAGYAQLLEMGVRGPVTHQQSEDLRRILRSEQHLLGLINELLNFARVERGEVAIEVTHVPIRDLTREVAELMEPQAAAKQLRLSVACDDDLVVVADTERLRQILLNLLTNAVKFTPSGGAIRVACAAHRERVAIAVTDTGIGIPRAKQDAVFDPFVQIDRGRGSHPEGIGLGLAISRSLARAMGGDVTVRSEPGKGSTFELVLSRATRAAAVS